MLKYALALLMLTSFAAGAGEVVVETPAPPVVVVRRHAPRVVVAPSYPIYPGAVVAVRIGRRPWHHHRFYYTERVIYR